MGCWASADSKDVTYHRTGESIGKEFPGSQAPEHSEGCTPGWDRTPAGWESCPCPTDSMSAFDRQSDFSWVTTYAALQWSAINIITVELANCHSRIFMGIHLDESKAAISLEARLDNIAKVRKQGNQVVLRRVWCQVPHVTGRLPGRSLVDDHIVTVNSVGGEVMVTIGGGRGHSHGLHGLLLGD